MILKNANILVIDDDTDVLTAVKLLLKTEASARFERGSDPRLPVTAMERACALLELTGAGSARGTVVDCYPKRIEPTVLRLRRAALPGLLGRWGQARGRGPRRDWF